MAVKPDYKQTEVGVIPEDWEVQRIGSVNKLINGRGFKPYEWQTAGLPIIRIQNLNGSDEFNYFSGLYDKKLDVIPGQLLFAWSGSRGTSFGPHLWRGPFGLLNYHTWKVQVHEAMVGKDFLFHQLARLTAYIEGWAHGAAALVHVQKWQMEGFEIPLPPTKAEQEAIAEALSDTDALIESLEELIAKKRHLKQGVMQELLTGKKRLSGFSGKWEVKQLGDLATFYKGKGLPKSALDPFGAKPCIHYGELFTQYPETIRDVNSRTDSSGDFLFSVVNDVLMPTSDVTPNGLAKASCVRTGGVILGGDILVIRANADHVFGSFLSYVIRHAREQVLQLVTGTTVFHLYAADMKKFTFAMPSAVEQRAIVAVLDDMDAEIGALEAKLAKASQLKLGMMQELLTGRIRLV